MRLHPVPVTQQFVETIFAAVTSSSVYDYVCIFTSRELKFSPIFSAKQDWTENMCKQQSPNFNTNFIRFRSNEWMNRFSWTAPCSSGCMMSYDPPPPSRIAFRLWDIFFSYFSSSVLISFSVPAEEHQAHSIMLPCFTEDMLSCFLFSHFFILSHVFSVPYITGSIWSVFKIIQLSCQCSHCIFNDTGGL